MSFDLKTRLRWLFYPGVNLHARLRHKRLPRYFGGANGAQTRRVLDAGSGNGMLSYQSYLKGNHVLGISIQESEVAKARGLFNTYLGIPSERLGFKQGSLYDLDVEAGSFDEIICTEVLEHLRDDSGVCRKFWQALKPGGALHITTPNAAHSYNASFPLDPLERGGHVRAGYTVESYRALLEPIGFRIDTSVGLGGPVRQAFNRRIKEVQERYGALAGVPLFLVALPCLLFEDRAVERQMPYSIYVKAIKTQEPADDQ